MSYEHINACKDCIGIRIKHTSHSQFCTTELKNGKRTHQPNDGEGKREKEIGYGGRHGQIKLCTDGPTTAPCIQWVYRIRERKQPRPMPRPLFYMGHVRRAKVTRGLRPARDHAVRQRTICEGVGNNRRKREVCCRKYRPEVTSYAGCAALHTCIVFSSMANALRRVVICEVPTIGWFVLVLYVYVHSYIATSKKLEYTDGIKGKETI